MSRQQAFEAIYAKQHDVPAESLVQYRHKSKDGYNLPGIASHYRTYCEVMDSEEIQALRKDAERYRFLKKGLFHKDLKVSVVLHNKRTALTVFLDGEYVDVQVDIAMRKGSKP